MIQNRNSTFLGLVELVRSIYGHGFVPPHRSVFVGNKWQYLIDCINSDFVSWVGAKGIEFEQTVATFIAKYGTIRT